MGLVPEMAVRNRSHHLKVHLIGETRTIKTHLRIQTRIIINNHLVMRNLLLMKAGKVMTIVALTMNQEKHRMMMEMNIGRTRTIRNDE